MNDIDVNTSARIRELADLYFQALDTVDFELLAECFLPESVMSYFGGTVVREGRDVFIAELKTLFDFQASTHSLANLRIRKTDAGLTGDIMATAYLLTHENKVLVRGLHYSDVYVEQDGVWKIKRRSHRATWQYEVDASNPISAAQLAVAPKRR